MSINELNISQLLNKIESFMFKHLINNGHILEDDGEYNVPIENYHNGRYTFTDSPEFGNRNKIDINKLIFINEAMNIINEIYTFAKTQNYSENIYFNPEKMNRIQYQNLVNQQNTFNQFNTNTNTNDIDYINESVTNMSI